MDISRHKGPAYESEGSTNAEAIMELNTSRHNLMDYSNSNRGSKGKSKRDISEETPDTEKPATESKPEDQPAMAVESMA